MALTHVGHGRVEVEGTMWEQRMWTSWIEAPSLFFGGGRQGRGMAFVWHWFAIRFDDGVHSMQCVTGNATAERPIPCTGVLSNNTHSTPLPVSTAERLRQSNRPGVSR